MGLLHFTCRCYLMPPLVWFFSLIPLRFSGKGWCIKTLGHWKLVGRCMISLSVIPICMCPMEWIVPVATQAPIRGSPILGMPVIPYLNAQMVSVRLILGVYTMSTIGPWFLPISFLMLTLVCWIFVQYWSSIMLVSLRQLHFIAWHSFAMDMVPHGFMQQSDNKYLSLSCPTAILTPPVSLECL